MHDRAMHRDAGPVTSVGGLEVEDEGEHTDELDGHQDVTLRLSC